MRKSSVLRMSGFIGTAGLTVVLVGAAVSGTGAYFTDSSAGGVTATMGTIDVTTTGGTGAALAGIDFVNMLPGEAQKKAITFKNTGMNKQDVWIVFPQSELGDFNKLTDTGQINDRGGYAEVHIKGSGKAVFDSANLADDPISCPLGASSPGHAPCNPLLTQYKLVSGLSPKASGSMEFSYTPSAMFKTGQGLPNLALSYKIVATQVGVDPSNALNAAF